MQISQITAQKWFWPVALIGGLLVLMLLSNREVKTPEGMPIVENDRQYDDALRKAHEMTKPLFTKADDGGDLTDAEKKQLVDAAIIIDGANRYLPTKAIPFLGAGKAYYLAGDLEDAQIRLLQCYNNSLLGSATEDDKLSGYEALYRLSQVYFAIGNYPLAYDMADKAVQAEPNGVNYLTARARALIQLKRLDEADRDLHAVLVLDPNHRMAIGLHKLLAIEDPKKFGPKSKH